MKRDKLKEAKKFAMKKHFHQKRKDQKTKYWKHLEQVVIRLEKMGIKDKDILCAGWLHDTIEDTDTAFDDIDKKFGKNVANIVSSVTKDTRLIQKQREKNYILQLKKASWNAKTVKLGDVVANIADLKNSCYSYPEQKKQVKDKIPYINAIKQGIVAKKSRFPGLGIIENELNVSLEKYHQKPIRF